MATQLAQQRGDRTVTPTGYGPTHTYDLVKSGCHYKSTSQFYITSKTFLN